MCGIAGLIHRGKSSNVGNELQAMLQALKHRGPDSTGYALYADWGYQNRTCGLRVSAPGRFEYRSVDSMHNPYLMGAALLKAMDDGLSNKIDPGKPESRNIYEAQKAGKDVKKLPLSLGEALDRLAEDKVIQSAMPDEMYKIFHWYKNDEWERFLGATTQWDLDTYLDCLP